MEQTACGQDCALACEETCTAEIARQLPAIALPEALEKFEREARRGTHNTGRYRMPYFEWGNGKPLVLIHGLGDSYNTFLMPCARLSEEFRCIAYNLPTGRGDGARPRRTRHADLVADLWSLLDHLNIRQSYVLGASFGSTIALTAMRERPDRIPRGIVQGGLARRSLSPRERWVARIAAYLPGTMKALRGRERVMIRLHGEEFKNAADANWRYFVDSTSRASISNFARLALILDKVDLRHILPEIRQPVLLMCGERDAIVPRWIEEILLEGLPNAGRVVMEGAGHVPGYSHPEVFAAVVRQFLTPPST